MHHDIASTCGWRKTPLAAGVMLLAAWLAIGPAQAQSRTEKWKSHISPATPDLIYRQHCAVCHGEKGDGKTMAAYALEPAPRDFTAPKAREELSRAHMIEVLNKGTVTKEGKRTPMIAWKDHLSREQIEAVVDYVIVRFMDGKVAQTEDAHDHRHKGHDHGKVKAVDYPYGLKANAARGKALYAANCAACHGADGDGRGDPKRVGSSKPRNFLDEDFSEFANGFSLFSAVSRGRGHMPSWENKLSNQEMADVSEYVLRTFVKTEEDHSHHHH